MKEFQTLEDYFSFIRNRLPEGSNIVLKTLDNENKLNKEELVLAAMIKRSYLDRILDPLNTLGLINIEIIGRGRFCVITKLGKKFLEMLETV